MYLQISLSQMARWVACMLAADSEWLCGVQFMVLCFYIRHRPTATKTSSAFVLSLYRTSAISVFSPSPPARFGIFLQSRMKMEPKPQLNARPANYENEKGLAGDGSPSINLGLGICAGERVGPTHATEQGKSAFTPTQLHELQQQVLIFKYIVSGLPVPFPLIFPIWKTVARCFGSANGGIYNLYPSFEGCSSSVVDYRNVVETQFQRCRRTDGKKWQCGKDVIPDKKYCGQHLHRGTKKRSMNSEGVTVAAPPPPPPSSVCHVPPLAIPKKADEHINLDTNLSISIAASPQQMTSDEGISASSSSSSDATTITDENGRVSHLMDLSP